MIRTQIILSKTIEANRRLRVRFLSFYPPLIRDITCPDFTWTEKCEKAMSNEHPRHKY